MKIDLAKVYLDDAAAREMAEELLHCVECGAANSVCATFQVLNNEHDSPRGRNRLIRDILVSGDAPGAKTVRHIDRCLSCNACTATCLAQVDFRRVMDKAREIVEAKYRRPAADRFMRKIAGGVLPRPRLFRAALFLGKLSAPLAPLLPGRLKGLAVMARETRVPARWSAKEYGKSAGPKGNIAILDGCVNSVIGSNINAATERVLTRMGYRIVPVAGGCCGALNFHLGERQTALAHARKLMQNWRQAEADYGPIEAIAVNASGCGSMVKDFAHLFEGEADLDAASRYAGLTRDVSELMKPQEIAKILKDGDGVGGQRVAFQPPCSLQHVQGIQQAPEDLLRTCGFALTRFRERDLCCGSAGTYSILQSEMSRQIRDRKVGAIAESRPDIIASANIGCMSQIASGTETPVVHLIELIDWATGGPPPDAVKAAKASR